ncbi:MAG TPA: GAF domain-containing protein [Acholeplasmataceae bacterium]|jgi:L-methionine (R)-S-oxide reductase|nr:GAF domain-containing protein [Acholeplasmataceae bacterium]
MGKKRAYLSLIENLDNLLECDHFEMSILANSSALIKEMLKDVNWVGFYLLYDDELLLGPFQGKVACTSIRVGYGVVGTCVERREPIIVPDVNKFPGHIPCDESSRSEVVIPIFVKGKIYAVLDLDSKKLNRFSSVDLRFLEQVAMVISKHLTREAHQLKNI